MSILYRAFGWLLNFIYGFVSNYGVSIILFTILTKVILFPLSLKQQKSMVKMQQVQPRLKEIQEKYKTDQQRQSEEMMKLYKEHGVNPMGGCLPLLIQLPILFALYRVMYQPLTYMLGYGAEKINALAAKFGIAMDNARMAEIAVAKAGNLIDFGFFGLDLSGAPSITAPSLLWIIPITAALTTFLSSKVTTAMNKSKNTEPEKPRRVLSAEPSQNKGNTDSTQSMTNSMNIMMPIMTLWITFTVPAALGLYWTISNVFTMLQQLILNKVYGPKYKEEVDALESEKELIRKEKYKNKKKKK